MRDACRRADRASPPASAQRPPDGLEAEEDEVGAAGELEREERGLGGDEQRTDADARGDRPGRLSDRDTERCEHAAGTSAEKRVANRQSRVLTRRDDYESRDADERRELMHPQRESHGDGRGEIAWVLLGRAAPLA